MLSFLLTLIWSLSFANDAKIQIPQLADKEIYHNCVNCHRAKKLEFVPAQHQPERIHQNISLQHGNKEMSCNFCHDKNNHNFLRKESDEQTDFRNPSGVCAQCHTDEFKSWNSGTHGKRLGGWMGERIQMHCTECHNPHSVKFKQMKAAPAPQKPKLLIPKNEEHK